MKYYLFYLWNTKLFANFITKYIAYFFVSGNRRNTVCSWVEVNSVVASFSVPNTTVFG